MSSAVMHEFCGLLCCFAFRSGIGCDLQPFGPGLPMKATASRTLARGHFAPMTTPTKEATEVLTGKNPEGHKLLAIRMNR
ncbi:hypothetical protein [Paenarthrobacter sp. PH39-S1]|uniref:hypothetical protein n=1 Tax=Paenarthrobacter sp. PH39-S1 TaxID=3046204 RepID=UPI0024BB268A|nr:hypothetical protein [Paenarthrobacter sp. PH39-S1]MDJ0357127.1 hypothetical protein [Paenarthrobacter sp. PH39-S1]